MIFDENLAAAARARIKRKQIRIYYECFQARFMVEHLFQFAILPVVVVASSVVSGHTYIGKEAM